MEESIDLCHRLQNEVGSYALMGGTGFEQKVYILSTVYHPPLPRGHKGVCNPNPMHVQQSLQRLVFFCVVCHFTSGHSWSVLGISVSGSDLIFGSKSGWFWSTSGCLVLSSGFESGHLGLVLVVLGPFLVALGPILVFLGPTLVVFGPTAVAIAVVSWFGPNSGLLLAILVHFGSFGVQFQLSWFAKSVPSLVSSGSISTFYSSNIRCSQGVHERRN